MSFFRGTKTSTQSHTGHLFICHPFLLESSLFFKTTILLLCFILNFVCYFKTLYIFSYQHKSPQNNK